jgi:DNA-binding transcriptional ArsR family regulator
MTRPTDALLPRDNCPHCDGPIQPPARLGRVGQGRPRRYCSDQCRIRAGNLGAWPSRVCAKQRCRQKVVAEGLCAVHLRLELKAQKAWTVRDEILDFLDLEGWATAVEIADRFNRHIDSVERVLRLLRNDGLVKSRVMELAQGGHGGFYDIRTEWKIV